MAGRTKTEAMYLIEANALVHDLKGAVTYKKVPEYNRKTGNTAFVYIIIRKGMGVIGRRHNPSELVSVLRNQLPKPHETPQS